MAENSKIEWTDHTFNPWVGCTKVSPACDHCYAESWARRTGQSGLWNDCERRRTSAANWRLPLKWNAQAEREGRRFRVFCASLADVFDNTVPREWRYDLLWLISNTPNLDWLLLTKRIGNAERMLTDECARMGFPWPGKWPNVWIGATVCNQEEADRDIPKLLLTPATVRFLSIEPMLGPIDLDPLWLRASPGAAFAAGKVTSDMPNWTRIGAYALDWIICGGESGHHARPMHPDWPRSLRDQCAAAGVPFFFKQWGEWGPYVNEDHYTHCGEEKRAHAWVDRVTADSGLCWLIDDDGDWSNWTGNPPSHADGRTLASVAVMGWHGKKAAGAQLDGRLHREFPRTTEQQSETVTGDSC